MKKKLKAKDLVMIGLLSLVGFVLMYVVPMPFVINPYGILITPLIHALTLALVYFLIGTKVQKPGAILIYSVIMGLSGMAIYYILSLAIAGFCGELILKKNGYGNKNGLTVSYVIFAVLNSFAGSFVPYLFYTDATYAQVVQIYGAEYAEKVAAVRTIPVMMGLMAGVVITAVLGSIISRKLLKKHFEKASIV